MGIKYVFTGNLHELSGTKYTLMCACNAYLCMSFISFFIIFIISSILYTVFELTPLPGQRAQRRRVSSPSLAVAGKHRTSTLFARKCRF